ncbi:hypothetical protein [Actomonas aquatica]|uniref:Uncharacterized protein n=1 Tax=Actomonas aquatica TaxID=2866162 RepID=A0ABZ1CGH3_9BACT|nr:hypothetical protein [Opitutus sp. WL0086]WRQ89370.1 hypothetical protein K1X11_008110 [Opitutus sp. WL0086]
MTPAQVTMTQIEFGKAWAARRKLGGGDQLNREQWRRSLKIRAGAVDGAGHPLPSKRMNNDHVDDYLKLCRGYSKPGNLNAQMELEEQPVKRALVACKALLDALQIEPAKREAYLAGIYRNTQRKRIREEGLVEIHFDRMPVEDLGVVLSALNHTAAHKLGKQHSHPYTGRGDRSRYAHRVGHQKAGQNPASQVPANRQLSPIADPLPFDQDNPF